MVRGCQRKVIFLKNTDSKIFTEAYFIVDDRASEVGESDMLREANRIIEENLSRTAGLRRERRGSHRVITALIRSIPAFIIGGGIATLICLAFL